MGLLPAIETTSVGELSLTETLSYAVAEPRVLGVDVSHWQGVMDWAQCAAAGAKFAFVRAGSIDNLSGVCYYDYQFGLNSQDAPKYLPTGFYWYFRPNHDPIKQANYFIDLLDPIDFDLPTVIDVEVSGGMSPGLVTDRVLDFIETVAARFGECIIYTRSSIWNPSTAPDPEFPLRDLWIARYTSKPEPWGNLGDASWTKPRDWTTWRFWQYSADGNGQGAKYGADSTSIDLNYFNGSEADLQEFIGIEEPAMSSIKLLDRAIDLTPLAGLVLTGVSNWALVTVPNTPAGATGVILRLVVTSDRLDGLVAFGAGGEYDQLHHYVARAQAASPNLTAPYAETTCFVPLKDGMVYRQHHAQGGQVKHWAKIIGWVF